MTTIILFFPVLLLQDARYKKACRLILKGFFAFVKNLILIIGSMLIIGIIIMQSVNLVMFLKQI